jgi:hypothetical protein
MIRLITTNRRRLPTMRGSRVEWCPTNASELAVACQRESGLASPELEDYATKQLMFTRRGLGCISLPIREVQTEVPD